jgi:hypothetical protein
MELLKKIVRLRQVEPHYEYHRQTIISILQHDLHPRLWVNDCERTYPLTLANFTMYTFADKKPDIGILHELS